MVPWSVEQVLALAPARSPAARPLAVPSLWAGTGHDDAAIWGNFLGGSGEPYATMVDHRPELTDVAARCTCPARATPCKHAVALMLMWAHGHLVAAARPPEVAAWLDRRPADPQRPAARRPPGPRAPIPPDPAVAPPAPPERRADRVDRVGVGLRALETWIDDRLRVGLGDPSIARYATWDELATRLVDAQAGSLANRVRRLAGHVGSRPGWHEHVLAELGVLHLVARAGQRLGSLEQPWADGIAAAVGFTVKQADVRAGVPDTARWAVMGRSDTVEDRIVVRRLWLRAFGTAGPRAPSADPAGGWAVVLSFSPSAQGLEPVPPAGAVIHADLHRYPGAVPLRALIGRRHDGPADHSDDISPDVSVDVSTAAAATVADALDQVGRIIAREPWIERVPVAVAGSPARVGDTWVLADGTGAVPLATGGGHDLAVLLAASGGRPVTITAEWTPLGLVPLTVHGADRHLDVGPRIGGQP